MDGSVEHNEAQSRYELVMEGRVVGIADYHLRDQVIVFPHTEIAYDLRGQGLGAVLVRGALDDVRETGRKVVPSCWYVAQFIEEHPEYRDLLAA